MIARNPKMNITERIDSIELKVRQLVQTKERLQRENAALKEDNRKLKAELDRQSGAVDALTYKLEESQRALESQRSHQPEDSEKLQQQLEEYIEEINKCIEWLHKQ